jgi:hypothetical protein
MRSSYRMLLGTTLFEAIFLCTPRIMLHAGLMKDIHALSDNTVVIVCVIITPIPSLSISFDHAVLSLAVNFLEMPEFKSVAASSSTAGSSRTTTGCC